MTDQHTGTSRLALLIDLERCTGCKSCEAACKQAHGLGPSVNRNKVIWLQGMEKPGLEFLPTMCQHCERPACLRACPVNPQAIRKDPVTGIVSLDEDRCTGCGECVLACPYGAMGFDAKDHHAVKCDLCVSHRKEGETTACASVCPGMAIQFGERETLVAQAEGAGRKIRDTDDYLLGPFYIVPRTAACPRRQFADRIHDRTRTLARGGEACRYGVSLRGRQRIYRRGPGRARWLQYLFQCLFVELSLQGRQACSHNR